MFILALATKVGERFILALSGRKNIVLRIQNVFFYFSQIRILNAGERERKRNLCKLAAKSGFFPCILPYIF